ncbi:hypothetical protein O6H91_14G037200 [Diphasiastrum complanatum]|uniref:Uncharacterized protein n=1 Tax=Diphasiastrum complanatum TaxID=34168 RepID=A0ACC2BN62_DIPCM|nr:hypothetical protein O6H91_14G037200 [Diphasiastrum complanatum]
MRQGVRPCSDTSAIFNFSPLFCEEIFFDETLSEVEADIERLNVDQHVIFDRVVREHVVRRVRGVFFVDGPSGTHKIYSVMLSYLRAQCWIALGVTSSRIAALLMKGGRSAHSRFRIPPTELNESSTCNILKQSLLGKLLMACRHIIWDR